MDLSRLINCGPPFYNYAGLYYAYLSSYEPEAVLAELVRFLKTLQYWAMIPCFKPISPEEIWKRCFTEGPSFAAYLSDCFDYGIRQFLGATIIKDKRSYALKMDSYDSIFPARYLFHFKEEIDDIQWALSAEQVDSGILTVFEDELEEAFSKMQVYPLPSDSEIVAETSVN